MTASIYEISLLVRGIFVNRRHVLIVGIVACMLAMSGACIAMAYTSPMYQAKAMVEVSVPEAMISNPTFPVSEYVAAQWRHELSGSRSRARFISGIVAYEHAFEFLSSIDAMTLWDQVLKIEPAGTSGVIVLRTTSTDPAAASQLLQRVMDELPSISARTIGSRGMRIMTIDTPAIVSRPVTFGWLDWFSILIAGEIGGIFAFIATRILWKISSNS